ncbi:hypothetical protein CAEBREN_06091 [Caenorhabditis brenneri]|uniref:TIL domain-containing protein n=1 Tax=Caenorhabditis brenneri TaxID=135651 RepID=G0MSA8_CAEBE|nr:hypothetical protein CAEBREN_06091 [Caenorhabditis brenneri]
MKFFIALVLATCFLATVSHGAHGCPTNEVFKTCGSACEPSCQKPNIQICTLQCILNVCQCKPGFVRGPTGCVHPSQCPPVYGK